MDSRVVLTANAGLLRQALHLLPELSDGHYASLAASCMEGTIGQHVRHIIDHYQCFLAAMHGKQLDYSARYRDCLLERDRELARVKISEVIATLEALEVSGSEPLQVLHEPVSRNGQPAASSVARELEFLLSHTIHHFALIAIALRVLGIAVPENFGLAFSTVNFRSGSSPERVS